MCTLIFPCISTHPTSPYGGRPKAQGLLGTFFQRGWHDFEPSDENFKCVSNRKLGCMKSPLCWGMGEGGGGGQIKMECPHVGHYLRSQNKL